MGALFGSSSEAMVDLKASSKACFAEASTGGSEAPSPDAAFSHGKLSCVHHGAEEAEVDGSGEAAVGPSRNGGDDTGIGESWTSELVVNGSGDAGA
jgi:hypothetical protein